MTSILKSDSEKADPFCHSTYLHQGQIQDFTKGEGVLNLWGQISKLRELNVGSLDVRWFVGTVLKKKVNRKIFPSGSASVHHTCKIGRYCMDTLDFKALESKIRIFHIFVSFWFNPKVHHIQNKYNISINHSSIEGKLVLVAMFDLRVQGIWVRRISRSVVILLRD